jgi:carotenoid cleavage dioxygenase
MATAHAQGETVIVHAIGPSLVRWTLHRRATTAHTHVIDATPHGFATSNGESRDAARRFLWTVGPDAVHKHDLITGTRRSHDVGAGRHPGQHVFVADPARSATEDGGWLVGLVHDVARHATDFVVLDAEAIEQPAVAVAPIPHRIHNGGHGAWISAERFRPVGL